jgi:putative spermidine/putrescine transport system permease protein
MLLAASCVAATVVAGVPCAYAMARSRSRWMRLFEELITLPVAVPGLATALALILAYGQMRGFRQSFGFILVGHLVFTLPFMVRTVASAFARPNCRRSRKPRARWAPISCSASWACWCRP